MATLDGLPTDETLRLYERLASGGAGLITTGFAYVSHDGQSYPRQNGIHDDRAVAAWRRITDRVHELGGKIAMQIAHGGRQTNAKALGGRRSVAPSLFPNFLYFTRPRPLTDAEIRRTIGDFAAAAARARAAGFDAVQIHAAHGYLLSAFLSPLTNRRRDEWGGDRKRRLRFMVAVCRAVRAAVGPDFPVLAKLNVEDFVPFGVTPRNSFPAARALAGEGLDAVEISGGILETAINIVRGDSAAAIIGRGRGPLTKLYLSAAFAAQRLRAPFREAYFRSYAEKLRPALNIPLILVGGIRSPETAENVLSSGAADFISLARPLIREPGLPAQWKSGDLRPATCVSCNQCLGEIEQGNAVRCYWTPKP
jgi:2,4-dienoyl-CoA reductase-like NADH-dependent reductase (Old Yellow Enzyme family)